MIDVRNNCNTAAAIFPGYPRPVQRYERCLAPPNDLGSAFTVFFVWASKLCSLSLTRRVFHTSRLQITSRSGYVVPLMQLGFTIWFVAAGLLYRFNVDTSMGYVIGTLVIAGIGVGTTMQTSLCLFFVDSGYISLTV